MGAGVPRPCKAKRAKESNKTGRPAAIRSAPRICSEKSFSSGGAKRHRQSVQGTHTASDPGATTRKRADPVRAPKRFIALAILNLGGDRAGSPPRIYVNAYTRRSNVLANGV